MRKLSEILEIGYARYLANGETYMCCILDDAARAGDITPAECSRARRWIYKRIKGEVTLGLYMRTYLGIETVTIMQPYLSYGLEANALKRRWWLGRIAELKRKGQ